MKDDIQREIFQNKSSAVYQEIISEGVRLSWKLELSFSQVSPVK